MDHHRALARSPKTVLRYRATFRLFDRFLADSDQRRTVGHCASRLSKASLSGCGRRRCGRSGARPAAQETSVHGAPGDLQAFTRWLIDEEVLPRPAKIRLPNSGFG